LQFIENLNMKALVYQSSVKKFRGEKLKLVIIGLKNAVIIIILIFGMTISLLGEKKKLNPADTGSVVDDLKDYSKKDNFFSKFVKSILVEGEIKPSKDLLDPDRKLIKKYKGKIIRKIDVKILDVFGASVDNPNDTVRGWFEDKGNSLHARTQEWLIKNMLVFSEGDKFIPFFIKESERIIRQYPYIYDVRIIPQKISNNRDSIDIIVYVQDIWSLNGGGSLNLGNKSGSFFMDDINFLGFGNEFKGGIKVDRQFIQDWDWDGSYTVNNISNTFITAKLYYLSEFNLQHYGIVFSRDFISPLIEWGGGIGQHWQFTRYPDTLFPVKYAGYTQQDIWLGYAFKTIPYDTTFYKQNSFNLAGRVTKTVFNLKPEYDSMNLFQDNIFYLGRIAYSDITFYEEQYIFGLGRTEDVPLVKMVEFLLGYESGENTNSPYVGLKSGFSFLTENNNYIYGGIQAGSYFRNNGWSNFTSIIEMMYFSKLHISGNWKWRHYIDGRLSYSNDPIRPLGMLNIDNEGGLRGFNDYYLKGNKKLVINYEADFFVPLKFLGFKLAIITFADFGLISSNVSSLFQSKLFQGYGIGIRIKNDHLIFPALQFMIGYYPNTSGNQFNIFYQNSIFYKFKQFQFSSPSVVTVQ
jgi:hypothetical protein